MKFGTNITTVTNWSSTVIIATVPAITTGNYTISITTSAGTGNSSTLFTVTSTGTAPTISLFTPASGIAGSSVTINGTNFGATAGTSSVKFGTTLATVTSWTATKIIAIVPALATGTYTISVTTTGGTANSSTKFTVTATGTAPTISSISPSSGFSYTYVTVSGTNFGAIQGVSTIKFGATAAAVSSWADTEIITEVPSITPGFYTISVTTSEGTANSPIQFTILSSTSYLTISGKTEVCEGQLNVGYTIGYESYTSIEWAITNGTIASGQGTNDITVNWNSTGTGTLTVQAVDITSTLLFGSLDVFFTGSSSFAKPVIYNKGKGNANILICTTPNAMSYQWYKNSQAINNVDGRKQFYVAHTNTGTYTVGIADNSGCFVYSNPIIVTNTKSVNINPNPATVKTSLSYEADETGKLTLHIVDIYGKTVKQINFDKPDYQIQEDIPLEGIEKGVYANSVKRGRIR